MNVLRLQAFRAFDDFKVDYLSFVQGFETLALNCGVMNEYILTGFLGDETKPLFIIEPLYFATRHNLLLIFLGAKKDTRWPQPPCVPLQCTQERMRLEITGLLKTSLSFTSRISFPQAQSATEIHNGAS